MTFMQANAPAFSRRGYYQPIAAAFFEMRALWKEQQALRSAARMSDYLRRDIGMPETRTDRTDGRNEARIIAAQARF